jgi:hypothetical protein
MRDSFPGYHPFVQLVLLTLAGFGAAFLGLIAMLALFSFYGIGWETLQALSMIGPDVHQRILFLKCVQIAQATGLFIVPYILLRWLNRAQTWPVGAWSTVHLALVLIFVITMISGVPFINLLAEWNSLLSLPEALAPIEQWIRTTEVNAEQLLGLFLRMDSLTDFAFNLLLLALLPAFSNG